MKQDPSCFDKEMIPSSISDVDINLILILLKGNAKVFTAKLIPYESVCTMVFSCFVFSLNFNSMVSMRNRTFDPVVVNWKYKIPPKFIF